MNKLLTVTAIGLALGASAVLGQEYRAGGKYGLVYAERGRLGREINHVNRMLAHVQWEVRHYDGGWHLRREVAELANEVSRVNWRYNHGDFNRFRLRREVERIHASLHNIEVRLHLRTRDYYPWD